MTKERLSSGDIIDRLAGKAGITKKLAAELLRAIPEVVEEGLQADGEAKVRGLGTFRLKTVAPKKGRNPQTGEEVIIPTHDKIVFQPEESFKDQANEDFKWLGIRVLEEVGSQQSAVSSQQSAVGSQQSAVGSRQFEQPVAPATALEGEEVSSRQSAVGSPEPEPVGSQQSAVSSPEPETRNPEPGTRNSPRWIIPVIIGVIAILSVVFYFRNCRSVLRPHAELAIEKPVAIATALNSGEVGGQQSAVGSLEPGTLNPEPPIQNSKFKIQNSPTHLFQLAREAYGNPFLWVLIYRANMDKISNPDQVVNGSDLTIPALQGTPKKLTHSDSSNVSDGYRLVYEYYLQHGDSRAEDFRLVMLKYKPQ